MFASRADWSRRIVAAALLAVIGCSGVDPVQEEVIAELKYQNERQRDLLSKNLREIRDFEDKLATLVEERDGLVSRIDALETNLRFVRESSLQATRERDQAAEKAAELERTVERVQQNLDKVKSVASASAGELAELRLKRQEYESQLETLSKREARLKEENAALAKELEQVKDELVRNLAVVRSLRGEGAAAPEGLRAALEELERVRADNDALKARLAALETNPRTTGAAETPAVPERPAGTLAAPAVQPDRPERLGAALNDLATLVKERWVKASRGEFTGDAVDLALLGSAAVVLLLLLWALIRWRRMARLSRQLRVLSARMLELEQFQAEGGPAYAASAPQPARRVSGSTRPRPTPLRRRSGFSAVISSKVVAPPSEAEKQEPEREAPGTSRRRESVETVGSDATGAPTKESASRKASAEEPAPPPAKSARKVIGARVWEEAGPSDEGPSDRGRSEEAAEEELASTQLIPALSSEPPSRSPAETEGRISAKDSNRGSPSSQEAPASGDDDLLEQLRAVVNRKFDELTKKK